MQCFSQAWHLYPIEEQLCDLDAQRRLVDGLLQDKCEDHAQQGALGSLLRCLDAVAGDATPSPFREAWQLLHSKVVTSGAGVAAAVQLTRPDGAATRLAVMSAEQEADVALQVQASGGWTEGARFCLTSPHAAVSALALGVLTDAAIYGAPPPGFSMDRDLCGLIVAHGLVVPLVGSPCYRAVLDALFDDSGAIQTERFDAQAAARDLLGLGHWAAAGKLLMRAQRVHSGLQTMAMAKAMVERLL